MALREMAIGKGDIVLLPAYHSMSMVGALLHSGAQPVLYKIHPDTSVDLDDVALKLNAKSRAIIVIHYFGFAQRLHELRAFCDSHGLLMLEDCAHCFFGQFAGRPAGAWGDYAIGSTMKCFPVYDGGCLLSFMHALRSPRPESAGVAFEAKAALNMLERAFTYRRLQVLHSVLWIPLRLKQALTRKKTRPPLGPVSSDSSSDFEPCWLDQRASYFSRIVVRFSAHDRIVSRRRDNYRTLERAVETLPHCRTLFPSLPDGVCPWMVPVLFDHPDAVFRRLRDEGIPMTRYGYRASLPAGGDICTASAALSRSVIAFPCHQALRDDEMAWMIAMLHKVLAT